MLSCIVNSTRLSCFYKASTVNYSSRLYETVVVQVSYGPWLWLAVPQYTVAHIYPFGVCAIGLEHQFIALYCSTTTYTKDTVLTATIWCPYWTLYWHYSSVLEFSFVASIDNKLYCIIYFGCKQALSNQHENFFCLCHPWDTHRGNPVSSGCGVGWFGPPVTWFLCFFALLP